MGHLSLYKGFTFTFKSIIALITLSPTEDERKCAAYLNKAASDALRVVTACVEMNPLWVP